MKMWMARLFWWLSHWSLNRICKQIAKTCQAVLWKQCLKKRVVSYISGCLQKFFQGIAILTYCLWFSSCWQMDIHKVLPFLYRKNSPWKTPSIRILLKIIFRWKCIWVWQKGALSVIRYSFCWIDVYSNIVIIANCRELSLNWLEISTTMFVVLSLAGIPE